jgi:sulfoxide reductase heme-binding subunit YedZ
VLKRPYILLGVLAFLCMVPLAVTSSNAAIRRMGAASWRRLHLLTYPVLALGLLHYITLSRVWTFEVLFYLGLSILLLASRTVIPSPIPARRRQ